jgi:hypothetical protein
MFSGWVWPEIKKVARDGLVGNGGSQLGQPSSMSAVAGEVRENWRRRRRRRKKKKEAKCVREVREKKKKKTDVLFSFYFY